jgi:hypothetical protein
MTTRNTLITVSTQLSFLNTGGSAVWTFSSIANAAGRLSARLDLGAYPRPLLWRVYFETQLQSSTPVVGNTVDLYGVTWDDESTPGRGLGGVTGSTDAAFATENDLLALLPLVSARVRSTSADVVTSGSAIVALPTRYLSVVGWNRSGATTTSDATEHKVYLTPYIPQAQNEV